MSTNFIESGHERSHTSSSSSFDNLFDSIEMLSGNDDNQLQHQSTTYYDDSRNDFPSSSSSSLFQTSPLWTSSSVRPPSSSFLVDSISSKFNDENYASSAFPSSISSLSSTLLMNNYTMSTLFDTLIYNPTTPIPRSSTNFIANNISLIGFNNDINNGSIGNDSMLSEEQMERNIYIMPLYQQIIWSIIFGTMVFVSAGGNSIVIWIVLTNKRMRTVTNYFLVNLSIADIMVSTLNVIFSFIYMLNSDWPFGELLCKITQFIAILSVAASVFTLMAISIDRYLAIVHPLRPRMSRTATVNIIIVIWITSSLLSLPNIICATTIVEEFKNGDSRVVCYLEWWDGISTKSRIEYIYNVIILLVTYLLPIVSMSYTYFCVGCELWGSQSIGEYNTARQMENIKSKRKIVKMMMIVVAIFGCCWAPYHIYFLLAHHYNQIINSEYVQHTYLTIYWLAMSNSMYNPFVYCWLNSRFRQGFRNVLCCCFCSRVQPNGPKRTFEHSRYHGAARYSCASELICVTDTRVRFNGNGNITTLHSTANIINNNNSNSQNNNKNNDNDIDDNINDNLSNSSSNNRIKIEDSDNNLQSMCESIDLNPKKINHYQMKKLIITTNGATKTTTTMTTTTASNSSSTNITNASSTSTASTNTNISPIRSKLKFCSMKKEML